MARPFLYLGLGRRSHFSYLCCRFTSRYFARDRDYGFLQGARDCDVVTRSAKIRENPAALMALMWYFLVQKESKRNMVILPYRDSLQLLSRYLQQLVMESLGKEKP